MWARSRRWTASRRSARSQASREWTIRSRAGRRFTLPTPGVPYRVEVHVGSTFTPADYGYPDTRQLGAQVDVEAQVSSPSNEHELRRHLDEAHRQLLERDRDYRFHEDELERTDREIAGLREELAKTQAWALELEATLHEQQSTRAWRFARWLGRLGR